MRAARLAVTVSGCLVLMTAAAGPAVAVAHPPDTAKASHAVADDGPLPEEGEKFELAMSSKGITLKYDDQTLTYDAEGSWAGEVEANRDGDDSKSVRLHTTEFSMSSDDEGDTGGGGGTRADGDDGTITIELVEEDGNGGGDGDGDGNGDEESLLELTQEDPARYEHTMVLSFTVTIEQPQRESLVLTTKEPAKLVGKLTEFPPTDDSYTLEDPVELVSADNRDETVATIEKFPVKVGEQ
jgi:hypothetical protein